MPIAEIAVKSRKNDRHPSTSCQIKTSPPLNPTSLPMTTTKKTSHLSSCKEYGKANSPPKSPSPPTNPNPSQTPLPSTSNPHFPTTLICVDPTPADIISSMFP